MENINETNENSDIDNQDNNDAENEIKKRKRGLKTEVYAETDLDQPTNFGLLYREYDETDSEDDVSFHDDATKAFYTEGTPYQGTPFTFSTSTSMSDLRNIDEEVEVEKNDEEKKTDEGTETEHRASKVEKGGTKAVTFSDVDSVVQATPMIFSRTSSLSSLSGFDQHSIHSSVVSEFSCLPSGVVSPSDLPDSPGQTVPPSPSSFGPSQLFQFTPKPAVKTQQELSKCESVTNEETGMFEDSPRRYMVEGTPALNSTTTSLSSFDCCSQVSVPNDSKLSVDSDADRDSSGSGNLSESETKVLSACITSGMPKKKRTNMSRPSESPSPPCLPHTSRVISLLPHTVREPGDGEAAKEMLFFHTEDTPVTFSRASSNSDLSVLSIFDESLHDDSDTADQDSILARCIQSGMPKPRHAVRRSSSNPIPNRKTHGSPT